MRDGASRSIWSIPDPAAARIEQAAFRVARRNVPAEAVYRDDLRRLPGNGWALYGLSETLRTQGRVAEADATQDRFELAWAKSYLDIDASCLCVTRK